MSRLNCGVDGDLGFDSSPLTVFEIITRTTTVRWARVCIGFFWSRGPENMKSIRQSEAKPHSWDSGSVPVRVLATFQER